MFKKSTIALGAILSAGLAFTASAETVIKVGHGAAESFHMHRALLHFEELVEAGSNGEIDVQIFPSSQMGPDREMIEGVQTGVLEMAIPPSSFFAGWDPAFAVIELPYIASMLGGPADDFEAPHRAAVSDLDIADKCGQEIEFCFYTFHSKKR